MDDSMIDYGRPTVNFILKEKIQDMMKYANPALANFPRRDKPLSDEIKATMLAMLRHAIHIQKKTYKKTTLNELDVELDVLRHYIRMAMEKEYYGPKVAPPLPYKKYEYWSKLLDEIGRIIGGMLKNAQ